MKIWRTFQSQVLTYGREYWPGNVKSPIPPWTVLIAQIIPGSRYRLAFNVNNTQENKTNYCLIKVKIREMQFSFTHNWRRIISSNWFVIYQTVYVITHFSVLSAIRFIPKKNTTADVGCILWSIYGYVHCLSFDWSQNGTIIIQVLWLQVTLFYTEQHRKHMIVSVIELW